jgi:hypothetical protein
MKELVQVVRVAPLHPLIALLSHNFRVYLPHFELSKLRTHLLKVQARSSAALTELLLVLGKVDLVQHEAHAWSDGQSVSIRSEGGGNDRRGIQCISHAKQRQSDHFANLVNPGDAALMAGGECSGRQRRSHEALPVHNQRAKLHAVEFEHGVHLHQKNGARRGARGLQTHLERLNEAERRGVAVRLTRREVVVPETRN